MVKVSPIIRNILSPLYWQRGAGYMHRTRNIHFTHDDTSVTFSAIIQGTSRYNTSLILSSHNAVSFQCSCMAFSPQGGCKHIATLARVIDRDYMIDENSLEVFSKNGAPLSRTLSQPPTHSENTPPDNSRRIDPSEYQIDPEILRNFPLELDPNNPDIISFLLERKPELLIRKNIGVTSAQNHREDEILPKQSRALSLLSSLTPSDTLPSGGGGRYYRIKLEWITYKSTSDIKMHAYEAKLLKNGNLSAGQEVYQDSIRGAPLDIVRLFVSERYASYYQSSSTALTFQTAPEMFIRLLTEMTLPISTLDNEPIQRETGLQRCRLQIRKTKGSKPYSIEPVFSIDSPNGPVSIEQKLSGKIRLSHAPNTPYYALTTILGNRLIFFTSALPSELLEAIMEKPLTLSAPEWAEFRSSGGFETLISHIDDLSFLGDEVTRVVPQIRLTIDISRDFDMVTIDYDFLYGTARIHPMSEKKILLHEDSIIARDIPGEQSEYARIRPLIDLASEHDPMRAQCRHTIDETSDVFFDMVETIISSGILVEYRQPARRISGASLGATVKVASGQDWFDIDVEFTLGDSALQNAAEILKALRKGGKYITLDNGTVVKLRQDIEKTLSEWDELGIDEKNIESTIKINKYNIGLLKSQKEGFSTFELPEEVKKLQDALSNFQGINKQKIPKSATVTLREYQQQGYEWLHFLHTYHFSGILADDMGLGKTIQTLVFLQSQYEKSPKGKSRLAPSLIVVPTSLVLNWIDEAMKFVPNLRCAYIKDGKTGMSDIPKDTQVIIISYGLLVNLVDQETFSTLAWHYVILDEAQNIKNSKSERAKAVTALTSSYRLALSGTPIENNLMELLSIFQFLMPGFLGYEARFRDRYMKGDVTNLVQLSRKIKPFILRRTKELVLKDLPSKQEEIIHLEMGSEQKRFYNDLKTTYRAQITEQLTEHGLAKSQFIVLDALLKLRQASLMPQLVAMSGNHVRESVKLQYIEENIEEMLTSGHSLLIFSQFTGFLSHIRAILDKKQIAYNYLDGQTKREERKRLVEHFNAGGVSVFLISLKVGGVGLNLTGADYVIHMDPWWNPAVENQATDRAHRMGQTKTVFVQKLIVRDTVEEKILKLQEKKKKLIDDLFSGDFHGSLSEADIQYIFE